MNNRVVGLETEYGCLAEAGAHSDEIIPQIRDWIFKEGGFGLLDLHDRGWDEPAGNGGFLFNGGRVYVDMGHIEYCTPECLSALDVVKFDRAGDSILLKALHALKLVDQVSLIRNNVDHYTGATFGCHENYSLDRNASLEEKNVYSLLAFLTLRVLYTGSGRVGSSLLPQMRREPVKREDAVPFQISQRADHIKNDFYEWVQFNRAIVNTRDEPLADPRRFRRLHLLHGDTNVLPANLFLKIGTTKLILDLLELNELPEVELQDAVGAMRALSRTLQPPWIVKMSNGKQVDAIELLKQYYSKAYSLFRKRDAETDAVLEMWKDVLHKLTHDREALVGILDWVSKYSLFEKFVESEGIDWNDPWLEAQDLEFHHIDPKRSLGQAIAIGDGPWKVASPEKGLLEPPTDTRALARSRLMHGIDAKQADYIVDWNQVISGDKIRSLSDPFQKDVKW